MGPMNARRMENRHPHAPSGPLQIRMIRGDPSAQLVKLYKPPSRSTAYRFRNCALQHHRAAWWQLAPQEPLPSHESWAGAVRPPGASGCWAASARSKLRCARPEGSSKAPMSICPICFTGAAEPHHLRAPYGPFRTCGERNRELAPISISGIFHRPRQTASSGRPEDPGRAAKA